MTIIRNEHRILGRMAERKLPRDPWVTLGLSLETIY
jgi:hypothetical protein